MASKEAKVEMLQYNAENETVSFRILLPQRSYATRYTRNAEGKKVGQPVKADVTITGTVKFTDFAKQAAEQYKLNIASKNRATAKKLTSDEEEQEKKLFELIAQMHGQEVDVANLEILPADLKELLGGFSENIHPDLKAIYATQGIVIAEMVANAMVAKGIGQKVEPDEEA